MSAGRPHSFAVPGHAVTSDSAAGSPGFQKRPTGPGRSLAEPPRQHTPVSLDRRAVQQRASGSLDRGSLTNSGSMPLRQHNNMGHAGQSPDTSFDASLSESLGEELLKQRDALGLKPRLPGVPDQQLSTELTAELEHDLASNPFYHISRTYHSESKDENAISAVRGHKRGMSAGTPRGSFSTPNYSVVVVAASANFKEAEAATMLSSQLVSGDGQMYVDVECTCPEAAGERWSVLIDNATVASEIIDALAMRVGVLPKDCRLIANFGGDKEIDFVELSPVLPLTKNWEMKGTPYSIKLLPVEATVQAQPQGSAPQAQQSAPSLSEKKAGLLRRRSAMASTSQKLDEKKRSPSPALVRREKEKEKDKKDKGKGQDKDKGKDKKDKDKDKKNGLLGQFKQGKEKEKEQLGPAPAPSVFTVQSAAGKRVNLKISIMGLFLDNMQTDIRLVQFCRKSADRELELSLPIKGTVKKIKYFHDKPDDIAKAFSDCSVYISKKTILDRSKGLGGFGKFG